MGPARDPRVHVRGFRHHPLHRESLLDAREAGFAHPEPHRGILQRVHDRRGERVGITNRDEQAVDTVLDDFGDAACP
jgi:hypothetical protein